MGKSITPSKSALIWNIFGRRY